jgi:hypothetical protein
VHVGNSFVAALYHPPAPVHKQKDLLDYIEACVIELCRDFPAAYIALAGDLNRQTDQDLAKRKGLRQIVCQRTRGDNILHRVYISDPHRPCRGISRLRRSNTVRSKDEENFPANVPASDTESARTVLATHCYLATGVSKQRYVEIFSPTYN